MFLFFIEDSHTQEHSRKKTDDTKQEGISLHIISGQKEITKNKSGMVIHNNIMTSENHQQKDAGQVYRKCCQGRKHICQTRTGHENRKEEGNNAKSMGGADSKISLSEN